jgi:hypothetical protein
MILVERFGVGGLHIVSTLVLEYRKRKRTMILVFGETPRAA